MLINDVDQQVLVNNYCKLRDFGHHATLQNSEQMIMAEIFENEFQSILPILEKVLK